MNVNLGETLQQFGFPLLGRLSDVFDLSADTWFKIAAVVVLWVYMILTSGRSTEEA